MIKYLDLGKGNIYTVSNNKNLFQKNIGNSNDVLNPFAHRYGYFY